VAAPELGLVAHHGWPLKYLLAFPHTGYIVLCTLASALMILLSLLFVRRGVKEGERSLFSRLRRRRASGGNGVRYRKARGVWRNPVAWREAATRASALQRGLMAYVLIGGGILVALILLVYYAKGWLSASEVRRWLYGTVMIEFASILLVATNTAATAMTKERDANTMDLLLCTPLTSRYIVWGKLRGLVSFAAPLIGVPVASVLVLALYDIRSDTPAAYPEAALELGAIMILFTAFACMLGMDRSLKTKKTVQAVMVSVAILVIICLASYGIGTQIIGEAGAFGAAIGPFTPFTAIETIMDPSVLFGGDEKDLAKHSVAVRIYGLFGSLLSVLLIAAIVWSMYTSMVRNFDRIVRKQSAT
jgi:hypothetical protein